MLTREQLMFRRSGLGGSDVAAVCGLSPFKRPIDVYLEKIAEGEPPDVAPTNAQRFGSVLEPVVANEYERLHGVQVLGPFASMRHPDRPWHLFTLDRLVLKSRPEGVTCMQVFGKELPPVDAIDRVLEIKTAGLGTAWTFGEDGSDNLPDHIICQVAWYLAGVGVELADVAALINTSDYREFHVQRDLELESSLLEEAEAFWKRVERREPPTPDGSEQFTRYVRDRFKKTTGALRQTNPEIDAAAAELRALRAAQRALDKRIAITEQAIKLSIGEADGVETAEGKITFKHDRRGKVRYRDVAMELMSDWTDESRNAMFEDFRGEPPRKLLVPRKWSSDETELEI